MSLKAPTGRLTEDGVRDIHRRRASGETYQAIANAVGVSIGTVYNVCTGKTWGWLLPGKVAT